ncbi:MAG: glutaminyl-peptide cyclotransferase [Kofleriaceae bacterium]
MTRDDAPSAAAGAAPGATSAEIIREYGPYPGAPRVAGVSYDGEHVWIAAPSGLIAIDPDTGQVRRTLETAADAGTAFDGTHLYQLADHVIRKLDRTTGEVLTTIPAPGKGRDSGLTWAEGTLWVGQYRDRTITQIDPVDGKVLRTIQSNRFVTGVTFVDGDLWHATGEGDASELRRVDRDTGDVLERLELPAGVGVSGLESDGADRLFCGGGESGKLRVVRRPKRG